MKTVVSVHEIAELEIKPAAEVARWRELVRTEIDLRWADRSSWIRVPCPACRNPEQREGFSRHTVEYVECATCGTLYAPRRPNEAALRDWYRDSAPAHFWRERLLPMSAAAREEKIVRPRADWVLDGMAEYCPHAKRLLDVSPHGRPLLEALVAGAPALTELVAAGVTADLEGPAHGRLTLHPVPVCDLPAAGPFDVALAVDVLDRAADLGAVVAALGAALAPSGLLFVTVPVASGFEVQVLWQDSPTIFPPDKLTLPTVEGLMKLFSPPAWEILELSTPGMFDVETVRAAMAARPDGDWPRAVRALVERTDAPGMETFVEFLQARRLTSFARLVARRRF